MTHPDMDTTPIAGEMCVCWCCGKTKLLGKRLGARFEFANLCICCEGVDYATLRKLRLDPVPQGTYPREKRKRQNQRKILLPT